MALIILGLLFCEDNNKATNSERFVLTYSSSIGSIYDGIIIRVIKDRDTNHEFLIIGKDENPSVCRID